MALGYRATGMVFGPPWRPRGEWDADFCGDGWWWVAFRHPVGGEVISRKVWADLGYMVVRVPGGMVVPFLVSQSVSDGEYRLWAFGKREQTAWAWNSERVGASLRDGQREFVGRALWEWLVSGERAWESVPIPGVNGYSVLGHLKIALSKMRQGKVQRFSPASELFGRVNGWLLGQEEVSRGGIRSDVGAEAEGSGFAGDHAEGGEWSDHAPEGGERSLGSSGGVVGGDGEG